MLASSAVQIRNAAGSSAFAQRGCRRLSPAEIAGNIREKIAATCSDFRAAMIHGSASDNVWFCGDQQILRWDGSAFLVIPSPPTSGSTAHFVSSIHTLGPEEAWAVHGTPEVYQLFAGALVARGSASGALSQLALTDEYVWHFSETNVRTLPRATLLR